MIPHPTTWQNARESERQKLVGAAERHGRETIALAAAAGHPSIIRSRAGRAAARRKRPALPSGSPGFRILRFRGPRLLTRLLAVWVAVLLILPIADGTHHAADPFAAPAPAAANVALSTFGSASPEGHR